MIHAINGPLLSMGSFMDHPARGPCRGQPRGYRWDKCEDNAKSQLFASQSPLALLPAPSSSFRRRRHPAAPASPSSSPSPSSSSLFRPHSARILGRTCAAGRPRRRWRRPRSNFKPEYYEKLMGFPEHKVGLQGQVESSYCFSRLYTALGVIIS